MTNPVHGLATILAVITGLFFYGDLAARDRQAPPPEINCERDLLTSYTGLVATLERSDARLTLAIDTDWETRETIVLEHGCDGPESRFLLNRRTFSESDWALLLDEQNRPADGLRATAWVCGDDVTPPVIDWQPP